MDIGSKPLHSKVLLAVTPNPKGISFNEISIYNNKNGAPFIELLGKTKKITKIVTKRKNKIHLSLSDEKKYALAMVVISY